EDIIVVEGRADVLNMLKHGFKNVIGMNGTVIPPTIVELCKEKTITLFVDGDRGGDLIIKELSDIAEIDFVVKAPDGKEVEEITKKEVHKALRGRVTLEQARLEMKDTSERIKPQMGIERDRRNIRMQQATRMSDRRSDFRRPGNFQRQERSTLNKETAENYKKMLEDLMGTRGAYLLDESSNILGKVPTTELPATIRSLNNVHAVIFDGAVTKEIADVAQRSNVKYLVAMESRLKPGETRVEVVTNSELAGAGQAS
ncbi:MAG: toprim domain-containing protein, partial [Nanoarchaeota archaeon]